MKLLNNRRFACAVLVVCVLGSVVGLGGNSLAAQRREAVRVFNEGVDTSFAVRFSMDAYLENCADYARTMAEEFRLHVDGNDENAAKALELAAQVAQEEEMTARRAAYESLRGVVETLYTDFQGVSEADSQAFLRAYSNFQGEVSKLGYDEYHAVAEKFNQAREGFPAGAVASIWGLEPLDSFR